MQVFKNFSAPTKAMSGRPAYSPVLHQIKSEIATVAISDEGEFIEGMYKTNERIKQIYWRIRVNKTSR